MLGVPPPVSGNRRWLPSRGWQPTRTRESKKASPEHGWRTRCCSWRRPVDPNGTGYISGTARRGDSGCVMGKFGSVLGKVKDRRVSHRATLPGAAEQRHLPLIQSLPLSSFLPRPCFHVPSRSSARAGRQGRGNRWRPQLTAKQQPTPEMPAAVQRCLDSSFFFSLLRWSLTL